MIDSHTHLDACDRPEADLVEEARRAGVRRILTVGTDGDSCRAALVAAEAFTEVYAAIGRHPNASAGFGDDDLSELQALAAHERCVAIGETGLDYFRPGVPPADQARAFAAHIELARKTRKPLVIHTRAAEDDTVATLAGRADGVDVVLHCFSMPGRLAECVERGWWISFAGNVTYPAAGELRAAAAAVPEHRLLVETDAPYLTPQPERGRPNRPALSVHTARVLAAERGVSYDELEATLERNAAEAFGW